MRDWLNFIRPPEDASWKEVNIWRWNVCLTLLCLVGFSIWSVTPAGFASEASVDKKIAESQKPLIEAQRKTDQKVDRMSSLLMVQLANSKAAEIRANIIKRCKTTDPVERNSLLSEKDRLQDEYEAIKGTRYVEPTCADL